MRRSILALCFLTVTAGACAATRELAPATTGAEPSATQTQPFEAPITTTSRLEMPTTVAPTTETPTTTSTVTVPPSTSLPPGDPVDVVPLGELTGTWTSFDKDQGTPGNCMTGLYTDLDGAVWATGGCGIALFEDESWVSVVAGEVFYTLTFLEDGSVYATSELQGMVSLNGGELTPVRGFDDVDERGVFWSAGEEGLRSYDGEEVTQYPELGMTVDAAVGLDGTVWVMQEGSLAAYDGTVWTIHSPEDFQLVPGWIEIDPDGALWLHFDGGLVRYDGIAWTTFPFIDSPDDIAFGEDGVVWVADADNGAFRFDGTGWSRYTTDHGLSSNNLTSVAIGGDGSVWFGTLETGISRFEPN